MRDERQDRKPDKDMKNRVCQANRQAENAQSATKRGSERSRENPKKRLQYLATGTVGIRAPQDAGYGTVIDSGGIVNLYSVSHVLSFSFAQQIGILYFAHI